MLLLLQQTINGRGLKKGPRHHLKWLWNGLLAGLLQKGKYRQRQLLIMETQDFSDTICIMLLIETGLAKLMHNCFLGQRKTGLGRDAVADETREADRLSIQQLSQGDRRPRATTRLMFSACQTSYDVCQEPIPPCEGSSLRM